MFQNLLLFENIMAINGTYAGRMMGRLGAYCIVPPPQVQRFLFPYTAYPLPSSDLFVTSILSVAVYTDVLFQDSLGIPLVNFSEVYKPSLDQQKIFKMKNATVIRY